MPVLGVPDVVVREAIDVHVETTIVVEVHVSHEIVEWAIYATAQLMQSKSYSCILFGGIKPHQFTPPTFMFFVLKKNLLFSKF